MAPTRLEIAFCKIRNVAISLLHTKAERMLLEFNLGREMWKEKRKLCRLAAEQIFENEQFVLA